MVLSGPPTGLISAALELTAVLLQEMSLLPLVLAVLLSAGLIQQLYALAQKRR